MIDTRRAIETPEGVELGLRVAGPIPRAYAWLVDLFYALICISQSIVTNESKCRLHFMTDCL